MILQQNFIKCFLPTLGNFLVTVLNESHRLGSLPDSQRKSVMSLIFKKDDDEDIANYRPISLTNVDYKIFVFTLTQRLQNIIKNLVNTDQSAYIKGRYMGTNIRLVSDVIEYYDLSSKSGIVFMLDFTKAFDTIQWDYRNQVWVRVLSRQNLALVIQDRPSLARGVAECKNEDCLYHECKILPRKHE